MCVIATHGRMRIKAMVVRLVNLNIEDKGNNAVTKQVCSSERIASGNDTFMHSVN